MNITKEQVREKAVEIYSVQELIAKKINNLANENGYGSYVVEGKDIARVCSGKFYALYPQLRVLNFDIFNNYGVMDFEQKYNWRIIEDCVNFPEPHLLKELRSFKVLEAEDFDFYYEASGWTFLNYAIEKAGKGEDKRTELYKDKYLSLDCYKIKFLDKEVETEFLNLIYHISKETQTLIDYIKEHKEIIKAYRKNNDIHTFFKKHLSSLVQANRDYYFCGNVAKYNYFAIEKFLRDSKNK